MNTRAAADISNPTSGDGQVGSQQLTNPDGFEPATNRGSQPGTLVTAFGVEGKDVRVHIDRRAFKDSGHDESPNSKEI